MSNALRALRWYSWLAVVFFGIVPAVLLAMLVARGNTPSSVGFLLVGGVPLVLAALISAVRGMSGSDPELDVRRLHLSLALVAGADVLMLGGNALIRATAN